MLSGRLWPAHPKPFSDELLSSWIVRVAEANGIKLQRLCWDLFGNTRSPWNRDIDRSAPKWLLKAMCEHTGTNYWDAYHTTLTIYRNIVYPRRLSAGQLRWILPVRTHGMRREGYGQQFCPQCLAEDFEPHFRKTWRLALFTFCPTHGVMLYDACPRCGGPVIFHRRDFGVELEKAGPICRCHACGFDFREAVRGMADFPDEEIREMSSEMLGFLQRPAGGTKRFDLGFFTVLHQFCRIMGSRQNAGRLREFVAGRLGMEVAEIELGRSAFEHRRVAERHNLLLYALWLMAAPAERVREAWEAKSVRYNLMLKDIDESPMWFRQLAARCSCWRRGYQLI